MAEFAFRIVNVFAEAPLAGNPLAVFEDARGIDDATLQALALQFNLSETTFVLPSSVASARVWIFTPSHRRPSASREELATRRRALERRSAPALVCLRAKRHRPSRAGHIVAVRSPAIGASRPAAHDHGAPQHRLAAATDPVIS
jgi:predicted PhzF superfamily epimerase YddE/YHI9